MKTIAERLNRYNYKSFSDRCLHRFRSCNRVFSLLNRADSKLNRHEPAARAIGLLAGASHLSHRRAASCRITKGRCMTLKQILTGALLATATLAAGPAFATMCQADNGRSCATGMPPGGYCQCSGVSGTVVTSVPRSTRRPADCRVTPQAPGCPG
jgi:hypothetical protein